MKLSIIIISYNTKDLLKQTIASIPMHQDWEIIVIDNASQDGSSSMVKAEFPQTKLIINKENLGFSKANNQALLIAKGQYLLLLNSDTIVREKAIENLLKTMDKNKQLGILSCQLQNSDGTIQVQGGYLPTVCNIAFWMLFVDDLPVIGKKLHPYHITDPQFFTKPQNLGWVAGTAMLIKKELIGKIGLLTEELFMYGEDVEYCLRARKAGYLIAIEPKAKIVHLGQKSSGGKQAPAWLGEFKGLKHIFLTHHSVAAYQLVRLFLKTGALLRMFVFGILLGRKEVYAAYKEAYSLV